MRNSCNWLLEEELVSGIEKVRANVLVLGQQYVIYRPGT